MGSRLFWSLFFISLLLKLSLAFVLPLSFDEAYYWVWSMFPQLSYYDHPGFVSWLLKLGEPLQNWAGAVRFPAVIFGHFFIFIWYRILNIIKKERGDEGIDNYTIVGLFCLFLLCPVLGFGQIVVTPDLPLVVFWSVSILYLIQMIQRPSRWSYSMLGSMLGLGFCSKYHIVLFLISLLFLILASKELRSKVILKYVPFTVFFGLVFSLPVLIWNYQNNFISFKYQLAHGLSNTRSYELGWTLEYIFGQLLIGSPMIYWFFFKRRAKNLFEIVLYWFAVVPLVFFFMSTFKSSTEPNWPVMAYLSIFGFVLMDLNLKQTIKQFSIYWATIYGILLIAASQSSWTWADKLREPYYYDALYSENLGTYSPLYVGSYQMASKLWFHSKKPVMKLRGMTRLDFFDFMKESEPEGDTFYLLAERDRTIPEKYSKKPYLILKVKSIAEKFDLFLISKKSVATN